MNRLWIAALTILAALPARADLYYTDYHYFGGEVALGPHLGGHGIVKLSFEFEGLPRNSLLTATFNTDTLELSWNRISLAGGRLETGAHVKFEAPLAGLLTDYYREGEWDGERGFLAGFVEAGGYLKGNLPGYQHVEIALTARRWFFWKAGSEVPSLIPEAHDALVLPADTWVLEPRLRYTLWRLQDDASLREGHRLYPRVRGVALGLEAGLDFRSEARPWGARDPDVFDPVDPRNDPDHTILLVRQWLRAGYQMRPSFRLQFSEWAGWGSGEDDLTRTRLGGLNPYVVPIAGAPWAAFLSDGYVVLEGSSHFRVHKDSEVGMLVNAAFIEDVRRIGDSDTLDAQIGIGLFADLRLGNMQIDLRAGWSPLMRWQSAAGQWSVFVAVGWFTDRRPVGG